MVLGERCAKVTPVDFGLGLAAVRDVDAHTRNSVPQLGAESAPTGRWLPAIGGDRAWAARTGSGPMRICGDIFPPASLWRGRLLTTGRLSCRHPIVCRTWREGRGGGAVDSVGVLRAQRCHLRAGFQQCKSFVEMGTVR